MARLCNKWFSFCEDKFNYETIDYLCILSVLMLGVFHLPTYEVERSSLVDSLFLWCRVLNLIYIYNEHQAENSYNSYTRQKRLHMFKSQDSIIDLKPY